MYSIKKIIPEKKEKLNWTISREKPISQLSFYKETILLQLTPFDEVIQMYTSR